MDVFDIPIPAAIGLLLGWILLCAFVLKLIDDIGIFEAFYFFFISMSTIGLGDITLNDHVMLFMFSFVLIGLSLVSMVISLIQVS